MIKPGKTVRLTFSQTPLLSRITILTETQEPSSAMPSLTETPTATLTTLPGGIEAVNLNTDDKINLVGFLHTPDNPIGEPIAVLLLYGYFSSHQSREPFAGRLMGEGFITLTFNFRGHGDCDWLI